MNYFPNFLLIAGTGRKSGKTTLACSIIEKFSTHLPLIGIKISPHFHGENDSLNKIKGHSDFNIYLETSTTSNKDTSRMLRSGAQKVYYIETRDNNLQTALEALLDIIPENKPVVCESPALGKIMKPGIFIIADLDRIKTKKEDILQLKPRADIIFNVKKDSLDDLLSSITYTSKGWVFTGS